MTAEGKRKPQTQLSLPGILFTRVCKSTKKLQSVNLKLLMSKGDGDRKVTFGLCYFDTGGGTQRLTRVSPCVGAIGDLSARWALTPLIVQLLIGNCKMARLKFHFIIKYNLSLLRAERVLM